MVRPRIMEEGKITTIMLDRTDMEIVEEERGDASFSGYLRALIRQQKRSGNLTTSEEKMIGMERKMAQMKAKLEKYEQREEEISREKEEAMVYIAQGYELYRENNRRSDDPVARQSWLTSRCKDSGITATQMTSYLVDQDIR